LLITAPDKGVRWAALGKNLKRPRVVLVVKRFNQKWFIERTLGCATMPHGKHRRCVSQVHFQGRTYVPERPRIQIGVGRAFGQGIVAGCFRRGSGATLVLRGPATPVTVWQEEEVPALDAVVVSLLHPGPTIYDSVRP
jgi:hypothetical protein